MDRQDYTIFGVIGRAGAVWLHGLYRFALVGSAVFVLLVLLTVARMAFMPPASVPQAAAGTQPFVSLSLIHTVIFAVPIAVLTAVWLTGMFRTYFEERFTRPYFGIDWNPVRLFLSGGVYLATVGIASFSAILIGAIVLLVVWMILALGLNLDTSFTMAEAEHGPNYMVGAGISYIAYGLICLTVGLFVLWFAMRSTLMFPHAMEFRRLDPDAALRATRGWGWTLFVTYGSGMLLFATPVLVLMAALVTAAGYGFGDPLGFRYVFLKMAGWPTPIEPIWTFGQLAAAAAILNLGYFFLYTAAVSLMATSYDAVTVHNKLVAEETARRKRKAKADARAKGKKKTAAKKDKAAKVKPISVSAPDLSTAA